MTKVVVSLVTLTSLILPIFTGCAAGTIARQPVSDALRRDAEAYAQAQDIALDKAIRRLRRQDPVGELSAVLEEQELGVFAGLWIQHEPEYKVVVSVTRDQRRIYRRYVRGGPLDGQVEIMKADVSWQALQAAHIKTLEILDTIGSQAHTGIDPQRNCVIIFGSPEALKQRVEAAGAQLPDPICFEPSDAIAPPPPLDPPPGITFPRREPPEGMVTEMTALLIGELVELDGCLRIQVEGGTPGDLVIWPYDHTITADGEGILEIRDGNGVVVARQGEIVQMGGGEVSRDSLDNITSMEIPERCASTHYWIAASGIKGEDHNQTPTPSPSP